MRTQLILLALTALLMLLSLVKPLYPTDQLLQHIPTVAALGVMFAAIRRRWFSTAAFCCLVVFLWLHILGARYLYSLVPYDRWAVELFDWSPRAAFGWRRNHYDRLVHLLFGMLWVLPCCELIRPRQGFGPWVRVTFSVCIVTTLSATYEVVEWIVAVVMSPESAERYNGQQGDMFDAQKDMALALVGSMFSAAFIGWRAKGNGSP